MIDFTYYSPTKILFGKSSLDQVGAQARLLGDKALVVYGQGAVVRTGVYQKVVDSLAGAGVEAVPFGGVRPNPRLSLVEEGVALCRSSGIPMVIAVGGGSAIDTAKAIAVAARLPEGTDFWDYCFLQWRQPSEGLAVGVVLTIPASGSETSDACVITNETTGEKRIASAPAMIPAFAILDPETTYTLPPYQTACGACDILAHLQERYFTVAQFNDLSDRLLEAAMGHVIQNAPRVLQEPSEYRWRAELMWAGTLAHNPLFDRGRDGGDWASHMIEHALSARYDIAHGAGLAIIIPAWMKYVFPSCIDRFVQYAVRVWHIDLPLDDPETVVLAAIDQLEQFYRRLGLPVRLSEAGLSASDDELSQMAASVATEEFKVGGILPLGPGDVLDILRLAR